MDNQLKLWQTIALVGIMILASGCASTPDVKPDSTSRPSHTPEIAPEPRPSEEQAPSEARPSATPSSCMGWTCTVTGVVYVGSPSPSQVLEGAVVKLSHFSNCSPTRGQHETQTGPEGGFEFELYIHDTDMLRVDLEQDGYEPHRQSVTGFDCVFCKCPPFEIVLQPEGTATAEP